MITLVKSTAVLDTMFAHDLIRNLHKMSKTQKKKHIGFYDDDNTSAFSGLNWILSLLLFRLCLRLLL